MNHVGRVPVEALTASDRQVSMPSLCFSSPLSSSLKFLENVRDTVRLLKSTAGQNIHKISYFHCSKFIAPGRKSEA